MIMHKKKYPLQDAVCVDKYTKLCEDAIMFDNVGTTSCRSNLLYRSELNSLENVENIRGKGGYFYEFALDNYGELFKVITDKYQTITYFGIDAKELRDNIINHNLRGIDRIVPIGKAMDINSNWDGHDLIKELSREVNLC